MEVVWLQWVWKYCIAKYSQCVCGCCIHAACPLHARGSDLAPFQHSLAEASFPSCPHPTMSDSVKRRDRGTTTMQRDEGPRVSVLPVQLSWIWKWKFPPPPLQHFIAGIKSGQHFVWGSSLAWETFSGAEERAQGWGKEIDLKRQIWRDSC